MSDLSNIHYVCPECGSDDIFTEATAGWNFIQQRWVLEGVTHGYACCRECGSEFELEEGQIDV